MKISKSLRKMIEEADFSIQHEEKSTYYFSKYSPAGQDFGFSIDTGKNIDEFAQNVLSYYEGFDVSAETYLWLGEDGHGRNGAPYDMRALYEDMEACEHIIYELYEIIEEYQS